MSVDLDSPAGSYRAAINPNAACAICRQSVCAHSDLEYAGIFPARPLISGFDAEDGADPRVTLSRDNPCRVGPPAHHAPALGRVGPFHTSGVTQP